MIVKVFFGRVICNDWRVILMKFCWWSYTRKPLENKKLKINCKETAANILSVTMDLVSYKRYCFRNLSKKKKQNKTKQNKQNKNKKQTNNDLSEALQYFKLLV